MVLECCVRYQAQGESVCPVCQGQLEAARTELAHARDYRTSAVRPECAELIHRGVVRAEEAGMGKAYSRVMLRSNSARREVIRLLGVYYPEPEAREVLRDIHDFKWLEAERAGFDLWAAIQPNCPLRAAAVHWARRYRPDDLQTAAPEAGPDTEPVEPVYSSAFWLLSMFIRRYVWKPARLESASAAPLTAVVRPRTGGDKLGWRETPGLPERTAPYWTSQVAELPRALQAWGAEAVTHSDYPWLVFPCEHVRSEHVHDSAVRYFQDGLQFLTSAPGEVSGILSVPAAGCCAVEYANVLLLSQLTLVLQGGRRLCVRFNSTGESQLRALLHPFLESLFPAAECSRAAAARPAELPPLPRTFAAAVERFMRPGEIVLSWAVQETTVEEQFGSFLRPKSETIPAAAVIVTNRRLVLLSAQLEGEATSYGCTTTMIPLHAVDGVYTELDGRELLTLSVEFAQTSEATLRLKPQITRKLDETLAVARRVIASMPGTARCSRVDGAP